MAKLQQMPQITQRLLRMVVKLLQSSEPMFRQDGRDNARDLMRLRKNGMRVEEGDWDLFESADGEIRFQKTGERLSVGSGVCLDGSLPRWPLDEGKRG